MLRHFTGSTGIRAAIAVLMLLFVVACSGSNSGIKSERDQALAAAQAAEEARLAAEEAARLAAEEAARLAAEELAAAEEAARLAAEEAARLAAEELAAAEEAARLAAEEAAAQAERDRQAAIEQARQELIAQQEKQSVMAAIAAAQAAVGALMDDSSDVDIAAASGAVASASAAIAAATTFSADDTVMYTLQVNMAATALATAQANIRAYRAEMAAQEAMNQATASARAKQAVDEAIAALTAADEAEAMSTAAYTAAATALSDAQTAVANANADTLADASAALSAALTQAATTAADLGVKTQAVVDATAALEAARATLAEVDPTHVALQAANAALAQAQTNANNQAEAIKALQQQIADLQEAEKNRMTAAEMAAEEERKKEMAAAGKALKKALTDTPLASLGGDLDTNTTGDQIASLSSSGLQVNVSDRADSPTFTASPTMKAGASAGSLGDWKGTHYAHKNAGTRVSNSAIVYTNQGSPSVKPFATGASFGADQAAFNGAYTPSTRTLALGADFAGGTDIKSDMFPTAGTTNYTPTAPSTETIIRGTYQGAPGAYRCTGATGCAATATSGGGVTLVGTWVFAHDSGAMTSKPDANYLFYGWWLQKDKDDDPTSASAFTGVVGADRTPAVNPSTFTGKATYSGNAAGKFAINDPIHGGDAGHFTADATLNATFGTGATNGISGTLDNFMANEQAVPWSMSLFRRSWNTTDAGQTDAADDPNTSAVDESATQTVWSIDGNSAAASGTWDAMAYDEKPGNAPSGDGSNVPTSVTGTFQSLFGSTHTMVGAFGATKE